MHVVGSKFIFTPRCWVKNPILPFLLRLFAKLPLLERWGEVGDPSFPTVFLPWRSEISGSFLEDCPSFDERLLLFLKWCYCCFIVVVGLQVAKCQSNKARCICLKKDISNILSGLHPHPLFFSAFSALRLLLSSVRKWFPLLLGSFSSHSTLIFSCGLLRGVLSSSDSLCDSRLGIILWLGFVATIYESMRGW